MNHTELSNTLSDLLDRAGVTLKSDSVIKVVPLTEGEAITVTVSPDNEVVLEQYKSFTAFMREWTTTAGARAICMRFEAEMREVQDRSTFEHQHILNDFISQMLHVMGREVNAGVRSDVEEE